MFEVTENRSPCIEKTKEKAGNCDSAAIHNSPVHSVNPVCNRNDSSPRTNLLTMHARSPIQACELAKPTLHSYKLISTPIQPREFLETLKMQGMSKTSRFQTRQLVEATSSHQEQVKIPLRTCSFVEETYKKNNFTVLPTHSTPPSQLGNKVVSSNPFEVGLTERLHLDFYSPSVFRTVISPSKEPHFTWTIEDLASIKPAPIEEMHAENPECSPDPEFEMRVQHAIDRYFTKQHMVQSPWSVESFQPTPGGPHVETPTGKPRVKEGKTFGDHITVGVQTMLSLPPVLPPGLEEALRPYFSSVQPEPDDLSTSTLRRKLFSHRLEQPDLSSPIVSSPVAVSRVNCSPLPTARPLSPLEISPIGSPEPKQRPAGNRSVARLDFSGEEHMSVDGSVLANHSSPLGTAPLHIDSPDKVEFRHFSSHASSGNGTASHMTSGTNTADPGWCSTDTTGYHTMGSTADMTTDESVFMKPVWETPWMQGAGHFACSTPTKTLGKL